MYDLPLNNLVAMMLSAGGDLELTPGLEWPLHQALRGLAQDADRLGLRACFHPMSYRPDPGVGIRVDGANAALAELRWQGALVPVGRGMTARLLPSPEGQLEARRQLMQLPAEVAALVYRTARRWASLAATASKNWSAPLESDEAMVALETPKPRHAIVPGRR